MRHAGTVLLGFVLALAINGHVHAQTPDAKPIVVDQPWARATPAGAKSGAAYMTLINNGSASDRLLAATTPVADKIQFHSVSEDNGVSRMREMHDVVVAPGARVTFSPGGMHVMLVGLKQPLKEGQIFPLSLTFEKAGKVDVTVSIAKVGAMQHGDMGPMMHEHGDTMKK
jgi:periplasmic copper chaperone A